ncbi:hypothetical protein HD597_010069 [Nonomuraea thailandensis]|uniref:Uncharacterized protein n=1 Tax=Nonomuraea thailandensis TaxID=1188745 RepID=A0A9X2GT13_9ACTN|nr:hypothetical protein [Nonomuraea thailandensis]MCP2363049.1 hypothetical protein [Nonomuraea thailandensis]
MTEDDWERSPDAARSIAEPPARVEARVQLLFGTQAEIVTAHHPSDDPLRVPAAALALQLGVPLDELPGRRFTAAIVGESVRDAELIR